jgi:hypothetical protein
MMMLWACADVPLGVYDMAESFNIALRDTASDSDIAELRDVDSVLLP